MKRHKQPKNQSAAAGTNSTNPVVIGTGGRVWPRKLKKFLASRYIALFAVYLIVVTVLAVGAATIHTRNKHQTEKQNQQRQEILATAAPNLINADPRKLDQTVERIKQQPNWETNPNYLYILLTYYISLSDAQNARLYYGKLVAVYDPKVGFDPTIVGTTIPMSDLERTVKFLEEQAKNLEVPGGTQQ